MKHSALLLALLTALAPAHAQDTVPVPPPTDDLLFELAAEPPRDRVILFAQARPEENRDRNVQRPPSDHRPPGGGGGFGSSSERRDQFGNASGKGDITYSANARAFVTQRDGRSRTSPIIVRSQPLDPKERAAAEEDLGIMARLLEKEIERETGVSSPPNALGIPITIRFEGRSSTLLLEGYGAVFTFTTRMPLIPPPVRATEKKPERPTDSPWERTRRELFGPSGGERGGSSGSPAGRFEHKVPGGSGDGMMGYSGSGVFGDTWGGRISPPEQYDAKKVEELKKSILEALKQASNIRALKPDDYLTVVVQGGDGGGFGPMGMVAVETRTTTSTSTGGGPPKVETYMNREGGSSRAGTLTVRAKKSDAEDFAKGKLTAEQFAKKALVNLH
ncbi:MAG: Uncharacterized protein FD161_3482 [Limisphaerales bacterium]|nr:MAG: Uncharacterized protein FD161_3482 [Limisphaerales bacterium]KAG0507700.1 MAG: Uncharacterized protein E1N63_3148 [Limisphaerales bacterium]TXT52428.1 MAG: Uncharacterized protein FD140_652 [Limisphaerales bacterium]